MQTIEQRDRVAIHSSKTTASFQNATTTVKCYTENPQRLAGCKKPSSMHH